MTGWDCLQNRETATLHNHSTIIAVITFLYDIMRMRICQGYPVQEVNSTTAHIHNVVLQLHNISLVVDSNPRRTQCTSRLPLYTLRTVTVDQETNVKSTCKLSLQHI